MGRTGSPAADAEARPAGRGPGAPGSRWAAALVVAAVAACYANSLAVPFQWDDDVAIVDHPCGGDLACWLGPAGGSAARRLGALTFWANRRVGGLDVLGYHLVNVAIHAAAALLVRSLAARLLRQADREGRLPPGAVRGAALVAALAFACHPVQTQAVTYIVQRHASLAGALSLAALVLYAAGRFRGAGAGAVARLAGAVACTALAMRTKETAFTLPLVVVVLDLAFAGGGWRRRAAWLAPVLATLPLVPLAVLGAGGAAPSGLGAALGGGAGLDAAFRAQTAWTRLGYLATQCRVVVSYLGLLLFPAGQSIDHDVPLFRTPWSPEVLPAALLLLALLAAGLAAALRARSPELRVAGFGTVGFFLALAVESTLVPIADPMVEHRLYLPSALGAIAVAALGLRAWRGLPAAGHRAAALAVAGWLVALGAATVARNLVWQDRVSLWTDAVEKAPGRARPHFNLGEAHREAGDLAAARVEWERTVALEPRHAKAWVQLGNVAVLDGDTARAEALYRRALAADPREPLALQNLASLREGAGRTVPARGSGK